MKKRICKQCGKEITSKYGRKFCSDRCKWHFFTDRRTDEWSTCDNCGKRYHPFKVAKYYAGKNHFCSRKCNMQFQAKQTTAEEFKERGRKSAEMKNMKDNDKIKKIKMMQAAVLERMMTPEEYEGLVNRYMENRGNSGMHQREKFLKKPLSPSEKDTLAQYFEFAPARKLAETLGARVSRDIIARIALRWIFQNKESLHLEELLKEGENK